MDIDQGYSDNAGWLYNGVMDAGAAALLFGLAAVGVIAFVPAPWMKAAGGLLIIITAAAMLIDGARLLWN